LRHSLIFLALFVVLTWSAAATAQTHVGVSAFGGLSAGESDAERALGATGVYGVGLSTDIGWLTVKLGVHRGGLLRDLSERGAGGTFQVVERPVFGAAADVLYGFGETLRLGVGLRTVAEWRAHELTRHGGANLDDQYDKKLVVLGTGPALHAELPLADILGVYVALHSRVLFSDGIDFESGAEAGLILRLF
jgi:hypothetical protein